MKKLNQNFKNPKFVRSTFIIHKNGNRTSIQPILKSNSTSLMLNKVFCEMNGKKVIHWGGGIGGMGELSKLLLGSVISVFTRISKYIGYPSNNHTFMPSIGSLCVGSFYIFIFLPYNHSPEK